jgi:hypothetical protein
MKFAYLAESYSLYFPPFLLHLLFFVGGERICNEQFQNLSLFFFPMSVPTQVTAETNNGFP